MAKRTVEVALSTSGLDPQGRPVRTPLSATEDGSVLTMQPPLALEPELSGDHMLINIGPQHPATHGVLRLVLELDGETVVRCIPHTGYLHCASEKTCEYRNYHKIIPWTDPRTTSTRSETMSPMRSARSGCSGSTSRHAARCSGSSPGAVADHLAHRVARDDPASTSARSRRFLWAFQERENVYNLLEHGSARASRRRRRASVGWPRTFPPVGPTSSTPSSGRSRRRLSESDRMLTKNAIWVGAPRARGD